MSTEEQLVTVRVARQIEAQIIKGRLESEGIPVLLSYESAGLVYGLTVDGIGEVRIMVPTSVAEEARAILETNKDGNANEGQSLICDDIKTRAHNGTATG